MCEKLPAYFGAASKSLLPDLTQSFQGVLHLGDALGSKRVLG
jgi:hypothetical protein